MGTRTALLVGATGLVGGHCLDRLLDDPAYGQVIALARRPLAREHPRLQTEVVDFDRLHRVPAADDLYLCLGATIRAAGSREAFYRVDHDYPLTLARLARTAGAGRLALVSSVGASPVANNYYLRMKGETERDVAEVDYECVELFRPSMLLGHRESRRQWESVAIGAGRALAPLLAGPLRRYRPVAAAQVAAAMVAALQRGEPGTHVRTFDDITRLAAG